MKIGIYGGTFDPPHLGHMEAARTALEQMNLDRLIIIPDCEPPHKDLAEEAATPQQRLEMAALMADGLGPRAEVSDLEIRREGKSYTADTVEALHETFPEDGPHLRYLFGIVTGQYNLHRAPPSRTAAWMARSSRIPLAHRSTSWRCSWMVKARPSPVPWSSTRSPSRVITQLRSTMALESSS